MIYFWKVEGLGKFWEWSLTTVFCCQDSKLKIFRGWNVVNKLSVRLLRLGIGLNLCTIAFMYNFQDFYLKLQKPWQYIFTFFILVVLQLQIFKQYTVPLRNTHCSSHLKGLDSFLSEVKWNPANRGRVLVHFLKTKANINYVEHMYQSLAKNTTSLLHAPIYVC